MTQSTDLSRRKFLHAGMGSSVALLAGNRLLAAGPAAASASTSQEIRCGMIGVGQRGTEVLKFIHQLPNVRITALCDINVPRLEAVAKLVESDKPRLFEDYHKMLEMKELDAVFVETPCHVHHDSFMAVLQSGRHCYGEKPLALTLADMDELVRTCKSSKGIFQIGTQMRYDGRVRASIQAVRDGKIGEPVYIRAQYQQTHDMLHEKKWLFDRKLSGDIVVEQAVHNFDLCNWVFGKLPEKAAGFGGQGVLFDPPGRDIMDHYGLTLDYGKNKTVAFSHSWIAAPKGPSGGNVFIIYGTKAVLDLMTATIYYRSNEEPTQLPVETTGHSTRLAAEAFFEAIRQGTQPPANVETGRDATRTAMLARKAIYEERVVTMKELLAEG